MTKFSPIGDPFPDAELEIGKYEYFDPEHSLDDAYPPVITGVHNAYCYFDWHWARLGFGRFSFELMDGELRCSCRSRRQQVQLGPLANEGLDRESIRKLLYAFADYIADNVILE